MGSYKNILIAPFSSGIVQDPQPWLTPMDSFISIDNVHVKHGYLESRDGYTQFSFIQEYETPLGDYSITAATQADPVNITVTNSTGITDGLTIFIDSVAGMTELNGNYYEVSGLAGNSFDLLDLEGANIDGTAFTAYSAGGAVDIPNGFTINAATATNPVTVTVVNSTGLLNGDTIYIESVQGMTELNGNYYVVDGLAVNTFNLLGIDGLLYTTYVGGGVVIVPQTDRIMGIYDYIQSNNSKTALAFNTTNAALFNGLTNTFVPIDNFDIMDGDGEDFIWAANYNAPADSTATSRLYFTNGKAWNGMADPSSLNGIRYYTQSVPGNTVLFIPEISIPAAGSIITLYGAKLIFAFQNRLILLNTYEGIDPSASSTNYPQRMRWSAVNNPDLWNDVVGGGGSYEDAATSDHIISARQLKDSIIVFFTDGVWKIVYTGNSIRPFIWKKINSFRGTFSKLGTVGYDQNVRSIGERGITATDGNQTHRIDQKIDDFSVQEINPEYGTKIFCLRDYENRRWISLFPGLTSDENDRALVYDDNSGAYTTYTIDMNVLGYATNSTDYSFSDFNQANHKDWDFIEVGDDDTFLSYYTVGSEMFLGGNISGLIFELNSGTTDNDLPISTSIESAAWNPYKDQGIESQFGYIDFFVQTNPNTFLQIEFFKDNDEDPYLIESLTLLPNLNYITSCITITQANPAEVTAPGHGLSTGSIISIYGVDGLEDPDGEIDINRKNYDITVVDENTFTLDGVDTSTFTAYIRGGEVVEKPYYKTKTWKRVYAGGIGYQHRMRISSDGTNEQYIIEAFNPYFKPVGTRMVN